LLFISADICAAFNFRSAGHAAVHGAVNLSNGARHVAPHLGQLQAVLHVHSCHLFGGAGSCCTLLSVRGWSAGQAVVLVYSMTGDRHITNLSLAICRLGCGTLLLLLT
jgi:hypothetical protein